jgi:hypothetical protein
MMGLVIPLSIDGFQAFAALKTVVDRNKGKRIHLGHIARNEIRGYGN